MNQRRKPKDPAQDSDPSDQTLILRPGASEEPTRALDARSTLALKGAEAQRMKEATGALPVQPAPSEEPTVALHISQVPAASTLKLPTGEPEAPTEPAAAVSTQKLRPQDIAWVAGESPEAPESEGTGMTAVDPTSRMRVSRSELSRIVKTKEASLQPPESRETAHLPLKNDDARAGAPVPDPDESGTSTDADRTLILKPEIPTAPVSVLKEESETAAVQLPRIEPASAAEATLILKPEDEQVTVPIVKPHPDSETSTTQMPMEAVPTAEAAPDQESAAEEGTVPIRRPMMEPEAAVMEAPQEAIAPAADATLVLKLETDVGTVPIAKPAPEPAPATMVMPQVEAKKVPEPAPATMVMPQVEAKPAPDPAPATMMMPQVEPQSTRPKAAGPGGTVPVMRTETPSRPDSAVPRPKAESAPGKSVGPGGTVQLMRTGPAEMETAKPAPVGGTVPVMRIPSSAPATQLMPSAKAEADIPVPTPAPPSTRPISPMPAAPEPAAPEPVAPTAAALGTLLVPVEELSRLAEVAPEAAPAEPTPIPPAASTAISTRLMPQQPPTAPVEHSGVPAAAWPVAVPAAAPSPTQSKSAWKLWAGLAGLAVILIAGAVLWLRPDLLGMKTGTTRRPAFGAGGDGPTRPIPASLKSAKDKADAGDAGSMRYLGTCYAHGLGVPRDVEEAKRWYRKAAEAGSQAAREELANLQRLEK